MNVCFANEPKFVISDNLSKIYLGVYNYNNLILFGFDTFYKFSFLSNINNLEQIGGIFYHLNEYRVVDHLYQNVMMKQ